MSRPAAALLLSLLLLASASQQADAQLSTDSVTMKVYSDGTAAITQAVSANANDTSVSLRLMSPILANPVVFDQNGSSLYFQITGSNITVYTVGATGFTLGYATTALTSKQGTVWTLDFTAYYNTTVVLPLQSTLTSVSGTPSLLSNTNGSPEVVVPPGTWEIAYGVPVQVSATGAAAISKQSSAVGGSGALSNGSSRGGTTAAVAGTSPSYLEPAALLGGGVTLTATVSLFFLRRRNASLAPETSELRPDDAKVIDFVLEKGGKVLEPEIRTRFAMPKTSAWRQIKRLERLGYLKVTKIGSQNQIELSRKREGQ